MGEITTCRLGTLALCSVLSGLPSLATEASETATINMLVSIVAPPCTINNNQVIEVEFGDVMTTRVDGNNYRMPVNYTLDCKNAPSSAMKLQVQGNAASFDSTLLQTSNPALGIKLQNGATALSVNTWLNFTYNNNPSLWVVPVKKAGAALSAGQFWAAATMKVDYQ
ncbi:fimbrial protein [Serratia fonticola]|uniref:fimbrial protein n=1 Tax=Serratia fonticola TaxID=47917 RepID=UPI0016477AB2|nr:fimbrial protein [Serratia fonticola]MBC3252355.1 fimbrial protein [Serratia fonticola]